jgi:aspartate carbamoyltransferase catalytic subunit
MLTHVLTARQFGPEQLRRFFKKADTFRKKLDTPAGRLELDGMHRGRVMATLFYEPSTRTRLSFESAAQRLGMGLISTENAGEFSSAIKGESLEDSIRVVASYADLVVVRHPDAGAAERGASVSGVPIINAGDGAGEHPTQALLDFYTIQRELGTMSGLTVAIGTDLKHSRTTRALSYMLGKFKGNHIVFVSAKELRMGEDIKVYLDKHHTTYEETEDLDYALKKADVVYWNRIQKERFETSVPAQRFIITAKHMKLLKPSAILMDPLPRVEQITPEVDADPRAAYFRQAENGLYLRMALIDELLGNTA